MMKRYFYLFVLVVAVMTSLEMGCTLATPSSDSVSLPTPTNPIPTCTPSLPSRSSFYQVLWGGDVDTALALLEEDPDLVHFRDNYYGETPLHVAVKRDYIQLVQWLVEHGADVNATAYSDFTPLHLTKNGTIARILINHGANLDQVDAWGNTPLYKAVRINSQEVVEAILDSGYSMDLRSALMLGEREYAIAIVEENQEILRDPIGSPGIWGNTGGADLWGNITPLGIVAAQGDVELVEFFVANGAPVNARTYMPNAGGFATPLSNAVWGGQVEVVEVLCANGANPTISTGGKFYWTIFDYAIAASKLEMIRTLIACGARPSADFGEHLLERCHYIFREKWPIILGIVMVGVAIASYMILLKRRKTAT